MLENIRTKIHNIKVSETLQAISDPQRRKILKVLKTKGPSPVNKISNHFTISLPSLSHHLNTLKNVNLVNKQRKGQEIYYSINKSVVTQLTLVLSTYFKSLSKSA